MGIKNISVVFTCLMSIGWSGSSELKFDDVEATLLQPEEEEEEQNEDGPE